MNRVKKTSEKYLERKPEIDRGRAIRSHTRRARKHAVRTAALDSTMKAVIEALPKKSRDDLRQMAKELGVPRRSSLTKAKLVEAITERLR